MKKNNDICTLYIVRHGETEYNLKKITYGHLDSPLTKKGVDQAKKIKNLLKNIKFDAIFSSDLSRARKTAEIIRKDKNIKIQTSILLRERFYGSYEGKYTDEFKKSLNKKIEESKLLSNKEYWNFKIASDIESDKELLTRFVRKLKKIVATYKNKNVLIISHAGCMRIFLLKMGYSDRFKLSHGFFKNGGYMKVSSDGLGFYILQISPLPPSSFI